MALSHLALTSMDRIVRAALNSPPMKRGETGAAVAVLQAALIQVGYKMPVSTRSGGIPDGIYGQETKEAVLRFQTDQHLSDKDGIAGKQTFTALDKLLMKGATPTPPSLPAPPSPPPETRDYQLGTGDPTITPDRGAGTWGSEGKEALMLVKKHILLTRVLPVAALAIGDDAAAHLYHYLFNSGRDLTIDLEGMVDEVTSAKSRFQIEVNQAKTFVDSLPEGTHSIRSKTAESAYNFKSQSANWYYAVGGYSTWGTGTAHVRRTAAGRENRLDFQYKFYDRYNWDRGKSVTIADIKIEDDTMGKFHRQGLAKEFDMKGSFNRTLSWRQGEAIPPAQLAPTAGR